MVNYKDLGLVNTREMFAKAIKGGYAIPAFNFNNMEQMQAIIKAAVETKSPVILQVSKGVNRCRRANMFSGFFVDRSIDGKSMAGRDKCKEFVI